MSEGLNLQTAGCLINYDMPWNLMRVEQRIGRIDRIGARYREIRVINYFYADTVEQRVYEGIAGDYSDFTDIVGNAQPVLGTVEKAIEQLALADIAGQGEGTPRRHQRDQERPCEHRGPTRAEQRPRRYSGD